LALTLESRRVGKVTVTKCTGRIVGGEESAPLLQQVAGLVPGEPYIVLNLEAVEFLDSSALGLLVRLRSRAQNAGGDVKLCALPPRVTEILRVTKLHTIFDIQASEEDAVGAFYREVETTTAPERLATDILCVSSSVDVIAYLREVLRQAGHGVMTSDNLPDALMLLRATRPRVIVMSAELRGANSRAADAFREMAENLPVVELPPDFSHRDAGAAARRLLDHVVEAMLRQ
jgi:anti-sigma B factor antagonist